MNITATQAILLGAILGPIEFAIIAYFTRANWRRIGVAVIAGLAYGLLNKGWDLLALAAGWWRYPFTPTGAAPLLFYGPVALAYGGGFGLIGWRVVRKWGTRGLIGFLVAWAIYGVIHDFAGTAATAQSNLIAWGPGLAPVIADFFTYGTCGAAAQLVQRLVAGPASADPLARTKPAAAR